jgi:hypothetical protein
VMDSAPEVSNSDMQVEYHEQGNQVAPLPNNSDQVNGVPSGGCPKGHTGSSSLDDGRIENRAASHETVVSSFMSDTSSLGFSRVQEPHSSAEDRRHLPLLQVHHLESEYIISSPVVLANLTERDRFGTESTKL